MNTWTIRTATSADAPDVHELLLAAGLPLEGLPSSLEHFLVAVQGERVVGAIGLELYPPLALLRSAVVASSQRNSGLGSELVENIEQHARRTGILRLVLLTTTAEEFFQRRGYRRCDRDAIKGPVTASAEFSAACPSTAVCMEKVLSGR